LKAYLLIKSDREWVLVEPDTGKFDCYPSGDSSSDSAKGLKEMPEAGWLPVPESPVFDGTLAEKYFPHDTAEILPAAAGNDQAEQETDEWDPLDSEAQTARETNYYTEHFEHEYSVCEKEKGTFVARSCDEEIPPGTESQDAVIVPQVGHASHINDMTFSPDGKLLATAGYDSMIILRNTGNYDAECILENPIGEAMKISFSPNGKRIASGNDYGTVTLWDVDSCKQINSFRAHEGKITGVKFSKDGRFLVTGGGDGKIRVWTGSAGDFLIRTIEAHYKGVNSIDITGDMEFIVSGGNDKLAKIWSFKSGELLLSFDEHKNEVLSIVVSPDDKLVYSCDDRGYVKGWSLNDGKIIETFKAPTYTSCDMDFSPHGDKLILSQGKETIVKELRSENDKQADTSENNFRSIRDCTEFPDSTYREAVQTVSPDGKIAMMSNDYQFEIREFDTGSLIVGVKPLMMKSGKMSYYYYFFKETGHSFGEHVERYRAKNNTRVKMVLKNLMRSLIYREKRTGTIMNPEKTIKIKSRGSMINLISTSTSKKLLTIKHLPILDVHSFTPDGDMLVTSEKTGNILLWSAQSGELITTLEGHMDRISECFFNQKGNLMATVSDDRTVKVWDLSDMKFVSSPAPHTSRPKFAYFMDDGKTIFTSDQNVDMYFWNIETGKKIATYIFLKNKNWLVYTPDGRFGSTITTDTIKKLLRWKTKDGLVFPCEFFDSKRNDSLLLEFFGIKSKKQ